MGNTKRVRYAELDIAKGIAILAVIAVHISDDYQLFPKGISFHLATFFAVSGILLSQSARDATFCRFAKKKVVTLLLPYINLSALYICFFGLLKLFLEGWDATRSFAFNGLYVSLVGSGIGTLWFLPTFFLANILFFLFQRVFHASRTPLCLGLMVLSLYLSKLLTALGYTGTPHDASPRGIFLNMLQVFLQTLIAIGFMEFGILCWRMIRFMREKVLHSSVLFLFLGLLLIMIDIMLFDQYIGNDLHYAKFVNVSGYLICSLTGTGGVLLISSFLKTLRIPSKLLCYLGRNSLIIMTTHFEYKIVNIVKALVVSLPIALFAQKVLLYSGICAVEMLICSIVNRTKLKFLFHPQFRRNPRIR